MPGYNKHLVEAQISGFGLEFVERVDSDFGSGPQDLDSLFVVNYLFGLASFLGEARGILEPG